MTGKNMTALTHRGVSLMFFVITLFAVLISLDKYWAPFDEGIVTVAGELILKGEIPYKDFFLVMYPPGQPVVLALLYKIFGVSITAGRVFAGCVQLMLVFAVYFIIKGMGVKKNWRAAAWLITLFCIGPRSGVIPSPIWTGIMLSLLSIGILASGRESGRSVPAVMILLAGITGGAACVFRHDIGIFLFTAVIIGFLAGPEKRLAKSALYILGFSLLPLAVFIYLNNYGALSDAWQSLAVFPFIHDKTARIAFPPPCFNPLMIFHQSLYFININQYYIPLIVYIMAGGYTVIKILKRHSPAEGQDVFMTLLVFGIFTFNQVRIRPDPAHLLTVIFPAVILFSFLSDKFLVFDKKTGIMRKAACISLSVTLVFFILLTIKNADKSFKNVIKKPIKGDVLPYVFGDRGMLYIPKEEREDVLNTVRYIKECTFSGERIYIGNNDHSRDDFGGSTVLYTLCERMPCVKYYEILPGLSTMPDVLQSTLDSLREDSVRYVILQDTGISGNILSQNSNIVDGYISKNFTLAVKYGKYGIYKKNSIHR